MAIKSAATCDCPCHAEGGSVMCFTGCCENAGATAEQAAEASRIPLQEVATHATRGGKGLVARIKR